MKESVYASPIDAIGGNTSGMNDANIPAVDSPEKRIGWPTSESAARQPPRRTSVDASKLRPPSFMPRTLAKLPDYTRAPFKAAPGKDKHGNELPGDPAWGMAFDLTDEQYDKFKALEETVITKLYPMRDELLPELAKSKEDRGGVTEENVRDAFRSKLKKKNEEKGYAPNLRVFVQHQPDRPQCKVSKMHLKEREDGTKYITKPVQGGLADLQNDRLAVVPIISLVRGVYSGGTGVGIGGTGVGIGSGIGSDVAATEYIESSSAASFCWRRK